MTRIIPRRPTTDKKTRMNGETAKLEAGSLILPKSAPWLHEFLLEYRAFPGGKYDDQMDALSQFLNWRTTAEGGVTFDFDSGNDDSGGRGDNRGGGAAGFGAPSPEELLWRFRR